MSSRRRWQKSQWLGPALGAGASAAAIGLGHAGLAPIAAKGGNLLGDLIKTYTGFGAYTVRSNALYEGSQVPFVRNQSFYNGTVISHREYLADITTSSTANTFKIQSFPINVGLSQTFEWLAQIACNYEEYSLEGCIFAFRSMSADALNSTNTALGNVIMATNYNPYNPAFTNKAEMESYEYAMSGRPSEDLLHPIECDSTMTPQGILYLRTGDPPAGADLRLYDIGTFYFATTGFQGTNVNIGELWVTYQVCLLKPKLYAALGYYSDYLHIYSSPGNTIGTTMLNTANILDIHNHCLLSTPTPGTRSLTFNFIPYAYPVTYLINVGYIAGVIGTAPGGTATATNMTVLGEFSYPPGATLNVLGSMYQLVIRSTGLYLPTSVVIDFLAAGTYPNNSGCLIYISQFPNSH